MTKQSKYYQMALLLVMLSCHGALAKTNMNYVEYVRPVLTQNCARCHNADKTSGGVDLSSYSKLMAGGSGGVIVVPGESGDSLLFGVISHAREPKMPPRQPKLPQKTLDIISQWISQGCRETSSSQAVKSSKPKVDLALGKVSLDKPKGPPIMPEDFPLGPINVTAKPGPIVTMATAPWAPVVAIGGQKQILLYHTKTHQLIGVVPFNNGFPAVVQFSRSGQLLIAGGGRGGQSGLVKIWSVKSGKLVTEVGEEYDTVLAADINPKQTTVVLGGPGRVVKIYDVATGEQLHQIKKHTQWITATRFSPDGILLATGDRNGGVYVWEAETALPFFTLNGHKKAITAISWRRDANVLATGSEDGTIRLWEMHSGRQIRSFNAHGNGVLSVCFARDGRLVSAGRDRRVKLWDNNGKQIRVFEPFSDIALTAVFDDTGTHVIGGDIAGQVRVWNAIDGKRVGQLSANPPSLDTFILNAKQQLTKINHTLNQAENEYQSATQRMSENDKKLVQYKQQHAANVASIKQVQQKIKSLTVEQKKQSDTRNAMQGRLKLQLLAIKKKETHATQAKNALSTVHQKHQKLEQQLKTEAVRVSEIYKKIAQANAKENQGDQQLADQAKQAESAWRLAVAKQQQNKNLAAISSKQVNAAKDKYDQAENTSSKSRSEMKKLQKSQSDLSNQLATTNKQLQQFIKQQQQFSRNQSVLDKQIITDQAQNKNLKARLTQAKDNMDKTSAQTTEAKRSLARYQAGNVAITVAQVHQEINEEQIKLKPLSEQLDQLNRKVNSAQLQVKELTDKQRGIDQLIAKREQVLKKATAFLASSQIKTEPSKLNIKKKKMRVTEFEKTLQLTQKAAAGVPDNQHLKQAAEKIKEAYELLKKDVNESQKAHKKLLESIEDAEFEIESAEEGVHEANQLKKTLPKQIQKMTEALQDFQSQMQATQTKLTKSAAPLRQLKKQLADLEKEYARHKKQAKGQ